MNVHAESIGALLTCNVTNGIITISTRGLSSESYLVKISHGIWVDVVCVIVNE